jgi:hypothetical protein
MSQRGLPLPYPATCPLPQAVASVCAELADHSGEALRLMSRGLRIVPTTFDYDLSAEFERWGPPGSFDENT